MSRTRRAVRGLLAACTLIFAAGPALAASPRFQLEGSGALALLSGSATLADGQDRRDFYPPAIGFAITAEYGFTEHIWIGVRSGLLDESKNDIDPSTALERWSRLPGYSRFRASQATRIERKLTTIPTHAILQWRGHLPGKIGYWDEVGIGVGSFSDKIEYFGASGSLMRLAGYQKNLSILLGAGLSWDLKPVTVLGGVDIEMIPSQDGDVWIGGDDPQFAHIVLGLRYPRR